MFCKKENESLLSGPCVVSADYVLVEEEKDSYQYPIDGWYWFDNEEDARLFFGLTDK